MRKQNHREPFSLAYKQTVNYDQGKKQIWWMKLSKRSGTWYHLKTTYSKLRFLARLRIWYERAIVINDWIYRACFEVSFCYRPTLLALYRIGCHQVFFPHFLNLFFLKIDGGGIGTCYLICVRLESQNFEKSKLWEPWYIDNVTPS